MNREEEVNTANSEDISTSNEAAASVEASEQDLRLRSDLAGGLLPDFKETISASTIEVRPTLSASTSGLPQKKLTRTNQNSSERVVRLAAAPTRPRPKKTESSRNNISSSDENNIKGKNALDAIGEYISFFFQRAEVYERELERQESKKAVVDKFSRGTLSTLVLTPKLAEDEYVDDEDHGDNTRSSTPVLSEALEALAAVEAMSSFRDFKDVKQEVRQSFHSNDIVVIETKKEKIVDEPLTDKWMEQWKRFVAEKAKTKFNEVAIQNVFLPLSVNEFYHHVIADNATHSIGKFMRGIGEKRVTSTPWQPSYSPTSVGPASRTIHYTHPITAPMAPPTAKALKQQSLHKFGNVGLCLETCTKVEDVPMADCFVVEDRLWVKASEDNNEECVVSVTFRLRFLKGTMFRRIIENSTRKEYGLFWDQFANMIQLLKEPMSLDREELQKVAIELEHATELLLESKGHEIQMSPVLRSSICTLSRRLSLATNVPSSSQLKHLEEIDEFTEGAVPFALRGIEYIRNQIFNTGLSFVIIWLFCLAMFYLNFMATRKMTKMNALLQSMDSRLDDMIEKLESKNCVLL